MRYRPQVSPSLGIPQVHSTFDTPACNNVLAQRCVSCKCQESATSLQDKMAESRRGVDLPRNESNSRSFLSSCRIQNLGCHEELRFCLEVVASLSRGGMGPSLHGVLEVQHWSTYLVRTETSGELRMPCFPTQRSLPLKVCELGGILAK